MVFPSIIGVEKRKANKGMENIMRAAKIIMAVAWGVMILAPAAFAQTGLTEQDAKTFMAKGADYYNKGDYQKAVDNYSSAILINPKNSAAYCGRALAYYDWNKYKEAIEDYTLAINCEKFPAKDRFYNRGLAYSDYSDYDNAAADFTAALKIDPNYGSAYWARGLAYFDKKMYDLAEADLTSAIRLVKNPPGGLYHKRGLTYYCLGKHDLALSDFNKALDLNKNNVEVYNDRGLAFIKLGKKDQAIADFKVAADKGSVEAKANIDRYGDVKKIQTFNVVSIGSPIKGTKKEKAKLSSFISSLVNGMCNVTIAIKDAKTREAAVDGSRIKGKAELIPGMEMHYTYVKSGKKTMIESGVALLAEEVYGSNQVIQTENGALKSPDVASISKDKLKEVAEKAGIKIAQETYTDDNRCVLTFTMETVVAPDGTVTIYKGDK
jgi:tetratricopeptide (TPR) repeat protein